MQAVAVALQCLSYDFVGTCLDESSEDLGTIQVRSSPTSSSDEFMTPDVIEQHG